MDGRNHVENYQNWYIANYLPFEQWYCYPKGMDFYRGCTLYNVILFYYYLVGLDDSSFILCFFLLVIFRAHTVYTVFTTVKHIFPDIVKSVPNNNKENKL